MPGTEHGAGAISGGLMPRFLFISHDGFGLGHVRRNCLIASSLRTMHRQADVMIVTGISTEIGWLGGPGLSIVRVPPMIKTSRHGYEGLSYSFEETVRKRRDMFVDVVTSWQPDVVVVDRHPYGVAGELRPGIEAAIDQGAGTVLGLRDVLDEPEVVRQELTGEGWAEVTELYSKILVYGAPGFCDHRAEYGLPIDPVYCGWVVEPVKPVPVEPRLLVIAGGGGGDGSDVFALGVSVLERMEGWRGALIAGPFADARCLSQLMDCSPARGRIAVHTNVAGCSRWFAPAAAVLQMAGYNSTFEALQAGIRPVLLPRWQPRQEQLIRARLLAERGLAEVVSDDTDAGEVARLLSRSERLSSSALKAAGLECNGARRTAEILVQLARRVRPHLPRGARTR